MAPSVGNRAVTSIVAATLLSVAGLFALPGLASAQEETWTQTNTVPVPGLTSFDIGFFEFFQDTYLLADRSNQQIVNYNIFGSTLEQPYKGDFVGAVKNTNGAVNNDLSGPNGVLAFDNSAGSGHDEVWAADGPQANAGCQAYLSGVCSAVKVFTEGGGTTLPPTHVIPTGGAARADELCHDGDHNLVMVANDAEADFAFGTPFVTFISTATYKVVGSLQIPFTTNGIEQCQYDHASGLFFLNIPEVGGPGNDTADGEVLAISPTTMNIVATYIIPTADCAGPQGMALGPEPQLFLGCNAAGPNGVRNSLIINKHTGALIAIGWGIGGADEVWFDYGHSHYYVTGSSCTAATCLSGTVQQLVVVDATGNLAVDQVIPLPKIGSVSAHSVAADNNGTIFSPNNGGIAVFTTPSFDSDDGPTSFPPFIE